MNTRAKVLSVDGETEMFEITAGVLQGDTLAPFLFIIIVDCVIVDYVMRPSQTMSIWASLSIRPQPARNTILTIS